MAEYPTLTWTRSTSPKLIVAQRTLQQVMDISRLYIRLLPKTSAPPRIRGAAVGVDGG